MIPGKWPRLEGELLPLARAKFPGLTIVNQRQPQTKPYKCVLMIADLQGRASEVSRYARIRLSGYSVRADGSANIQDAHKITADVAEWLETLRYPSPLIKAEINSGPTRQVEDDSEFSYAVVLAEVSTK